MTSANSNEADQQRQCQLRRGLPATPVYSARRAGFLPGLQFWRCGPFLESAVQVTLVLISQLLVPCIQHRCETWYEVNTI